MYDARIRRSALACLAAGESLSSVSRRLGVSRSAVRAWRDDPPPRVDPTACPRCTDSTLPSAAYAELLGLYLGDGCLSEHRRFVYALRVACDDVYPNLITETAETIAAVNPGRPVHRVQAPGCTQLVSYWKHWPCLFPQHGPGRKHHRSIVLAHWQREVVAHFPELFLRGLFLSDGCRVANWTTHRTNGEVRRYDYVRYMFFNESTDIMRLCQWALDLLALPWRMPRPNALSVARREDVAQLDRIVGPKS
ncbi:helix-turn-helix domain-containing protein [Kribbella sp. CA-253562]|uniref:helix-turn-helix domain-containing protein n=1 Tax=Kribbella sp. CA-253562 TaxID=3239942 RepID=UPI003D8EF68E